MILPDVLTIEVTAADAKSAVKATRNPGFNFCKDCAISFAIRRQFPGIHFSVYPRHIKLGFYRYSLDWTGTELSNDFDNTKAAFIRARDKWLPMLPVTVIARMDVYERWQPLPAAPTDEEQV